MASKETQDLQKQALEERFWFNVFASPKYRQFDCIANQKAIDEYLTAHALTLNIANVDKAITALGSQLAVVQRHSEVSAAQPTKTVIETESGLPAEFTRERILHGMDRDEYKALRKQYGDAVIEERVNQTAGE